MVLFMRESSLASPRANSICDLELAIAAAQISYAIGRNDEVVLEHANPRVKQAWVDAQGVILEKGYRVDHSIAPQTLGATSKTPLSAVCLKPEDDKAPIVIAFKGTKFDLREDLKADMHIGLRGVAHKVYRDAAYQYYLDIRQKNPGRRIVLAGHSLGGNLASYVGVKAYNRGETDGLLEVRTFNSAPIRTAHAKGIEDAKKSQIQEHFINYRTQNDPVSKNVLSFSKQGVVRGRYGRMITLINPANDSFDAHHLRTLKQCMPDALLKQTIGSTIDPTVLEQLSIEKLMGSFLNLQHTLTKITDELKSTRNLYSRKFISPSDLNAVILSLKMTEKQIGEALKNKNVVKAHDLLFGFCLELGTRQILPAHLFQDIFMPSSSQDTVTNTEKTTYSRVNDFCVQSIHTILAIYSRLLDTLKSYGTIFTKNSFFEHKPQDENKGVIDHEHKKSLK